MPGASSFLFLVGMPFVPSCCMLHAARVVLGRKLANSSLVGQRAPSWVTFAGQKQTREVLERFVTAQFCGDVFLPC